MADTGVQVSMTKEDDQTRERLGKSLKYYSREAA